MIGVRLGVDVGKARIGLARSDTLGTLAVPLETVPRQLPAPQPGQLAAAAFTALAGHAAPATQDAAQDVAHNSSQAAANAANAAAQSADIARICDLAAEHNAVDIVVGLPLNLQGERTASTEDAEYFALSLAAALTAREMTAITVRLVDERMSTRTAQHQLQQAGKSSKKSRAVIDQAAAVVILQHALDSEQIRAGYGTLVGHPSAATITD